MNTDDRPACDGHYDLFWALIDNPGSFYLRKEAARFCGTCPLRDHCLPENLARGGEDGQWANAIVRELKRPKTKLCEWCGTPMTLKVNAGTRRRYCSDTCGHLGRKVSADISLDTIAPEIRTAHAEHVRLRRVGTPLDEIPDEIRAMERDYQSLRHLARKNKAAVA